MKDLEFTGERFVPGIDNAELEIEHYQRYFAVLPLVKDKVVVDAACGEGYGANIISSVAKSVIGIDISEEAIAHAEEKYGSNDNISFLCESIADMSITPKSIDVFVSFETLEHVAEDVQKKFLASVSNILKDDGMLVISTPNKKVYTDDRGIKNEFHVHEFYYDEFIDYLRNAFDYYKIYHQFFEVSSVIDCDGERQKSIGYNKNSKKRMDGKYYIAVASKKPIADVNLSHIYLNGEDQFMNMHNRILTLQKEEEDRNIHIAKLDSEIEDKNGYIRILQTEKEDIAHECERAKVEKGILEKKTIDLENNLKDVLEERDSAERKINELLREVAKIREEHAEYKEIIEGYNSGELYDKAYVDDLKLLLANKEGHIEQLLEAERAWEREKQSPSYQKILKKRARRDKLFPKNSKRRFFLDVLYQCVRNPRAMSKIITPHKIKTFFKVLKHDGMSAVNGIYQENLRVTTSLQKVEVAGSVSAAKENDVYTIDDFEKLYFNKWNEPTVSIVIPVYNEFRYTYSCLKSILMNTGDVKYEILIANDCSTDCTSEVEKVAENVRLITTEHNCRFLLNCNNAAKYVKGKYIFFLNNDTQVKENWLQPLIDLIESDEKIGMVGSKLVYPDGTLQEAGGILWKDGSAWNYGNRKDAEASEYNYVKEADYISGAAIMIKSELWNEIGGFDERFAPAYCEDSDLAFEVRKHGYKVLYQPKSEIVHFEGVSNGTDVNSGLKSYQVENSKKFFEKWRDVLEKEHFENAQNVFQARDKSAGKKCILFIDHYVPQFDKDAGSRTVFAYLKLFVNKGYNVKFIGDNYYRHEPYTEILQQMGIEVLYGPHYAQHWKEWIKENAAAFDYIFLNRPHISETYIDFVKAETNAKIIYYGHDLHYVRETREYELTGDKALLKSAEEWKKREFSLMEKADSVYYPSEVEVAEIKKVNPEINAAALTAYIYDTVTERPYVSDERKNLLFVGGFGHGPNIDAVKWFCTDIFPKVLKKNPDIKFEIVGSNAPDEILALKSDNIIVHGFVSDEKLEELYGSCKMAVIPLRYGAGIKGKVVEAMSQGVPVITTAVGAEGIVDAENILFVKDDIDEIVNSIVELYDDSKALSEASEKSYEYIKKYFSADAAWESICKDFV